MEIKTQRGEDQTRRDNIGKISKGHLMIDHLRVEGKREVDGLKENERNDATKEGD